MVLGRDVSLSISGAHLGLGGQIRRKVLKIGPLINFRNNETAGLRLGQYHLSNQGLVQLVVLPQSQWRFAMHASNPLLISSYPFLSEPCDKPRLREVLKKNA